jgi:DNA-binding MarR family transcriptional regulator
MKQDPERVWNLFLLVDAQTHDSEIEKLEISGRRLNRRLRCAIARIAAARACEPPSEIKQRELAEFLGVSEEAISRQLRKLRGKGFSKGDRTNCA